MLLEPRRARAPQRAHGDALVRRQPLADRRARSRRACLAISLATLAWNEYVVPSASLQAHYVDHVQIKNKTFRGHFNERGDLVPRRRKLHEHRPLRREPATRSTGSRSTSSTTTSSSRRIVEARVARWTGERVAAQPTCSEMRFAADGVARDRHRCPSRRSAHRDARRTSRRSTASRGPQLPVAVAARSHDLRRKGIDTTEARVDLWLKLAVPFTSVVMALIAIPLASRHSRGLRRRGQRRRGARRRLQLLGGAGAHHEPRQGRRPSGAARSVERQPDLRGDRADLLPQLRVTAARARADQVGRDSHPQTQRGPRRGRGGSKGSALRVLRTLARLVAPVLLALDLARIARDEAGLLQRRPELRIRPRAARA